MPDLLGHTHALTWWQECNRAVVVLIYGLFLVRLAGRRVFGKWSAIDIIVSIMVGSNLSRALTGGAPLGGTLAATTLMMLIHWLLSQAAARWSLASTVLEGRPQVLARDGQLDRRTQRRGAISENDIQEALRGVQVEDVAATRLVMVEPSGKITVLKAP
jgi:uncharacterized membrane protein YcaP (DUF421 family)